MGRKPKYSIPPWKFNSTLKNKSKKFVQMYHNQLFNQRFMKMKANTQMLYIRMLDYSNGNQVTEYPHRIYKQFMTTPTFLSCIEELVENGFVEVIEHGKFNHRPNKYKFIDKWYKSNFLWDGNK